MVFLSYICFQKMQCDTILLNAKKYNQCFGENCFKCTTCGTYLFINTLLPSPYLSGFDGRPLRIHCADLYVLYMF